MTMKKIMIIKINKSRVDGEINFHTRKLRDYSLDLTVNRIKIQKLNRKKIETNKKVKRRMAKQRENGEKKLKV